jgi:hypothetical protein
MDVSVSHLNNRLALQLPAQLPLGLVFVLGEVEKFVNGDNGRSAHKQFNLVEKEHRVRCLLSERVLLETDLQEGSVIRAGGHLIFDAKRAGYYLLVRDVEIVQSLSEPQAISREEMVAMMEETQQRAKAENLVQSELPPWVKKLAPIEYREDPADANGTVDKPETVVDGVENKQLAELSAAMDSDEDIELTSSLLEVAKKLNQARGLQVEERNTFTPTPVMGSPYAQLTDIEDPDAYTPTGKITSDRILVLVIIVALMLFLMIMLLLVVRGF